ncbi:uncharacterized protein LOC119973466 isoform X2 [Scyliorhinus canicula]|uniref:uncharacterized protein LOC119973466 isoform X2 n=1 Tax=Scyliorhinus canicula TaxID=7830 RepID=UPI0018F57599|nr:uncharacterized protein LOC119973466 isoform X2 [Scyliorhinus canicula]
MLEGTFGACAVGASITPHEHNLNLIKERCAGHMELGCCDMPGMMFQGDWTADDLLRFHQCLSQEPLSMHQVQGTLSQMLNGLNNSWMLFLDSRNLLSDLTEHGLSYMDTWRHFLSEKMTHYHGGLWNERKALGEDEGERLKTMSVYLMEIEQEKHRLSTRWAVGGVAAVIHDDGQEMEPMGAEDQDSVSNIHLLQMVTRKYKILTKQLHQEMLQEHWGQHVWNSLCDGEQEWKIRELEALADHAVIYHYDTWTLSQLPGAFKSYNFSLSSIMASDVNSGEGTLPDGNRNTLCGETPSSFINRKQEVSTSLSLLLDLHRCYETEMSSVKSASMSPAQKTQFLLSQYYLQCQAQQQDTFETCALVLSITDREETVPSPRSETLAVRRLQEFICSTLHQKAGKSEVTASDISDQAMLGRVQIQMRILEQLCKNHQEEQSLLLLFIYKQMMVFPGVESSTMMSLFSDTSIPGQNGNDWLIPPGDYIADGVGHLQLQVLKEAFVRYWERNEFSEHLREQSPAIQGLINLQQRQLSEVRKVTRQLEEQSLNDLVHTFWSLHDDFRSHHCHSNLAAMFLGPDPQEKDNEQIGEGLESSIGPVQDRMDKTEPDSDTHTINLAEVKCDELHFSETPVGDFPVVQDPVSDAQKVVEQGENFICLPSSQSQQEEIEPLLPRDEESTCSMSEEYGAKGKHDQVPDQQCPIEDRRPRELPCITGPQREVNMILISEEEKESVMRSLTLAQRKAGEKRQRDRERQTLRVQECLSIARNKTSPGDRPLLQTHSQDIHTGHLHQEHCQFQGAGRPHRDQRPN